MVYEHFEIGVGAQPQVFVSYARQDAEPVRNIASFLEEEGITVWRDGDRILGGQYYGEQIVHAIAHSRVVLLMCSPHAFQSDNVHREVLLTWDYYHRCYLPIWLSPTMDIPVRFRYCLAGCQWIDADSQPSERWLPQLLKAFKALGVESKGPTGQSGESTSRPAAETNRRGLRFRPGDRPVRGADWELERLLGKGGFGEVWKAHNPDLPGLPPVALKFCLELDDRSKGLLRHEANMVLRAQQQIRSDGIVPLLHAYLNNDPPCLEYPYVEGGTLVRLLDECRESAGSFTPAQVERIVQRIAQIVSAAHRATPKLVHRDLKPSNILVARQAEGKLVLRVTDFGIGGVAAQPVLERSLSSSSLEGNLSSVLTGSYSPLYASPQQIRGDKPDPRDDVYALGVIWYQLLVGDLTRPAPTGRKWIEALRRRGMSDAAIDLMGWCFESDPADRPDDAGILAEKLQALTPSASSERAAPAAELPLVKAGLSPSLEASSPPQEKDKEPARALEPSPPPIRIEAKPGQATSLEPSSPLKPATTLAPSAPAGQRVPDVRSEELGAHTPAAAAPMPNRRSDTTRNPVGSEGTIAELENGSSSGPGLPYEEIALAQRSRRTAVGLSVGILVIIGIFLVAVPKKMVQAPRQAPPNGQPAQSSSTPNSPVPSNVPPPLPKIGVVISSAKGESTATHGETEKANQTTPSTNGNEARGEVKLAVETTKPPISETLEISKTVKAAVEQAPGHSNAGSKKNEPQIDILANLPPIPPGVQSKLDAARKAVAEAVIAVQDAGLIETSIDPPPILDILITGCATDGRTLKDQAAKKPYSVSPEVFGAWFCGYGILDGIDYEKDVRIANPSAGLKQVYDERAAILRRHIRGVRSGKDSVELRSTQIPRKVELKLEIARRAVAEVIVAAQDAGLVETSIDPPPILDILITGRAVDARTMKNSAAKKPYSVSPEVFGAWFTGYGSLEGIDYKDVRLLNPSAGLKQWYNARAQILRHYIGETRKQN
jgi:serine/threonine protein kinase